MYFLLILRHWSGSVAVIGTGSEFAEPKFGLACCDHFYTSPCWGGEAGIHFLFSQLG